MARRYEFYGMFEWEEQDHKNKIFIFEQEARVNNAAIASCDSYASFVLRNLSLASMTQYCTLWRLTFVKH